MKANDTAKLRCSWNNGLIWAAITLAVGVGARYALWYFIVWQGDPDIFWDSFAFVDLALLMFSVVFVVLSYLLTYRRYMLMAQEHPTELHAVATGMLGKPWISRLVILIILELAWLLVNFLSTMIGFKMDLTFSYDRTACFVAFAMGAVSMVIDLILFGLGNKLFKPNLVQNS